MAQSVVRMSSMAVLALGCCVAATSTAAAQADALLDQLHAIPGLTVVQEKPTTTGGRFFLLTYEQPVNHLQPWKGTFMQRVTLYHQGFDRPMVFYSGGYHSGTNPSRTEITRLVTGNQITIEHRFFEPSRPVPADWDDLTIFQQASDDHRVVQAFKNVYPAARWLRTGPSKGGMQATYHTRFFPHDVDGLIAYVAPNDAIDNHDAYAAFLANVGTDPQCRENLKQFQRQLLIRRGEIVPKLMEMADLFGFTYDRIFGSPDKALELLVVELPFSFWQLSTQADCALIPPATASTQDLFDAVEFFQPWEFFTDDFVLAQWMPYYYQAGTQLGYPKVDDSYLADLLRYPGEDVPRSFVSPEIAMPPFQWWAMLDIDIYVRFFGRHQMFIYGENDPWGAERFRPGPHAADSFVYTVPGGNHSANVAQLSPADQAAALATIRRWAGLPPMTSSEITALRTRQQQQQRLEVEPDLDQIDRMMRRPRVRTH
jgi:hypothetical protein